jgi:2-(1,2-epoxy-1,2-dihydrophenyl)acetyl-CoA isomerase
MQETVKLEKTADIARIQFNRPQTYNAFDLDMIQSFAEILVSLARDPEVTGVTVTGAGKAFCAGGDLAWANGYGPNRAAAFHELAARYHQAILEIRRMPKPVVAAIHGFAAGGGFSLALACDFRVMEASAKLKQAYTSSGLSIDGGGTFSLARLVGPARALEIAAFDPVIDAQQAEQWGLVTEIVEDGNASGRAFELVREVQARPLSSFAASKKLLTQALDTPLEVQLEKERALLAWCAEQPDGREGIAAFLEKRNPVFNKAFKAEQ